ncbi:hypothetical protein Chor_004898 [Crotalus horridus]
MGRYSPALSCTDNRKEVLVERPPCFAHLLLLVRLLGLECQRPKHQHSSDEIEVLSTGTPLQQESPELYRKGTTPSDLTPDDSPLQSFPASPSSSPPRGPSCRNKNAHFSRQLSMDEERGGEIQMLLEGRSREFMRPNSWGEDKEGGPHGMRGGVLRSGQLEDHRGRSGGHKHGTANHKPRERWADPPTVVSWTYHRPHHHGSGSHKLTELDEEKLSNYEMEMKPLMRMDAYMQEMQSQKRHHGKMGLSKNLAEEHPGEERAFGVQRLRSTSQNKENVRPASSGEPAVQKLESLRFGDKGEPRLLRWDLTCSPPQKSLPVALESEAENGDELKSSAGSAPILVVMVILLNIGVAILRLTQDNLRRDAAVLALPGDMQRLAIEIQGGGPLRKSQGDPGVRIELGKAKTENSPSRQHSKDNVDGEGCIRVALQPKLTLQSWIQEAWSTAGDGLENMQLDSHAFPTNPEMALWPCIDSPVREMQLAPYSRPSAIIKSHGGPTETLLILFKSSPSFPLMYISRHCHTGNIWKIVA